MAFTTVLLAAVLAFANAAAAAPVVRDGKHFVHSYRISAERQVVITATLPSAAQLFCIFIMSMLIATSIEAVIFVLALLREQVSPEPDHDPLSCPATSFCHFHERSDINYFDMSEKTAALSDETVFSVCPAVSTL